MYKVVAKNFEKHEDEHRLDLEIFDGEELVKEKVYTCSFNQFTSKRKKRLVSIAMIYLEMEGVDSFEDDYNASDLIEDDRIEVVENFTDPYE